MLSEKIALKKSLIEALTGQLRIAKRELKRLEGKQRRLAEFFTLQDELLSDPDTQPTLQGSLHAPVEPANHPRLIEITEPEASYELRLIDIEGDEPKAIATPVDEVVEVEAVAPQQPPSLDEVAPLDEMQSYRREELYRQIESAMKAVGMKTKEGRKLLELMFGNGVVSRHQLNVQQLEKFLTYLTKQHAEKIEAIASTIKVEWQSESSGITIDAEGEVRPFTCDNWASPTPEFTLVTGEGKELKSTWNNKGIEANPYFLALRKSLHSHFLNAIENAGYILEPHKSDNLTRQYIVWAEGQKIGKVKQHFASDRFSHSLQPNSIYTVQFSSPIPCLEDLKHTFNAHSLQAS